MAINLGSGQIQGLFIGSSPVDKAYLGDVLVYGGEPAAPSVTITGTLIFEGVITAVVVGVDSVLSYTWDRVYEDYVEPTDYTTQAITLDGADRGYFMRVTVEALVDSTPVTLSYTTVDYVRDIDYPGTITITQYGGFFQGTVDDANGVQTFLSELWERSDDGVNGWVNVGDSLEFGYPYHEYSTEDEGKYFRVTAQYRDYAGYTPTVTSAVFGPLDSTP